MALLVLMALYPRPDLRCSPLCSSAESAVRLRSRRRHSETLLPMGWPDRLPPRKATRCSQSCSWCVPGSGCCTQPCRCVPPYSVPGSCITPPRHAASLRGAERSCILIAITAGAPGEFPIAGRSSSIRSERPAPAPIGSTAPVATADTSIGNQRSTQMQPSQRPESAPARSSSGGLERARSLVSSATLTRCIRDPGGTRHRRFTGLGRHDRLCAYRRRLRAMRATADRALMAAAVAGCSAFAGLPRSTGYGNWPCCLPHSSCSPLESLPVAASMRTLSASTGCRGACCRGSCVGSSPDRHSIPLAGASSVRASQDQANNASRPGPR